MRKCVGILSLILILVAGGVALAQEETLEEALAALGLQDPQVTVTAEETLVAFVQPVADVGSEDEVAARIAEVMATVAAELPDTPRVRLRQNFDDGQVMEIVGYPAAAEAFLAGDLALADFWASLNFIPRTRGPLLLGGVCQVDAGDTCRTSDACACYPNERCLPSSRRANEKGCVTASVPDNATLVGPEYVCDEGYEWNADLTACVPELVCPAGTVKAEGECLEGQEPQTGEPTATAVPGELPSFPPLPAESEPNNRLSEANPIANSGVVTGTLDPQRDGDVYMVQVGRRGELVVRLTNVPGPLNPVVRFWDPDLDVIQNYSAALDPGTEVEVRFDVPGPGLYRIEVRDAYDDAASPDAYQLETQFTPAADPVEPNDSFGLASPLVLGEPVQANILPQRDSDWYRLHIPASGELALTVSDVARELDVTVQVWSANGDRAWNLLAPVLPGGDTEGMVALTGPADYVLEVRDGRDDGRSALPYRLATSFTPAADTGEPNDIFGQASALVLGEPLQASILPQRDSDWYRFTVPVRGELHIQIADAAPTLDMAFRLWDANRGVASDWFVVARTGQDVEAWLALLGPAAYVLEVRDNRDDAWAVTPYTLTAELTAVADATEDNDTLGRATALALDEEVQAAILPRGDHDWYRVEVATAGELQVYISDSPPELNLSFRILDGDKGTVLNTQTASRLGADVAGLVTLAAPGVYYIEVADSGNDAASAAAYTLLASFTAE